MKYRHWFCRLFLLLLLTVSNRQSVKAQPYTPFELVVEKIERRDVTPNDIAEGHDTLIVVSLTHKGIAPLWWEEHNGGSSAGWGDAKLFYEKDDKERPVPLGPSYKDEVEDWSPDWNPQTQHYEARYLFKLSSFSKPKENIVLRGKISLRDFGWSKVEYDSPENVSVPFSYTVLFKGQEALLPKVSRDPKLEVRQLEIEKLATPKSEDFLGSERKHDTIIRIYIENHNSQKPGRGTTGYPRLVDEKGKKLPDKYQWFPVVSIGMDGDRHPRYGYQLLLSAFPQEYRNITLDINWSEDGNWPLRLQVPLRRDGVDRKGQLDTTQYRATPLKGRL